MIVLSMSKEEPVPKKCLEWQAGETSTLLWFGEYAQEMLFHKKAREASLSMINICLKW